MNKILFIGSFLSKSKGTQGIAESLSEKLLAEGVQLNLVSQYQNKLLRMLEIIFFILFHSYKKVHIDVFSGSAFTIADIASRLAKFRKKEIIFTLHGGKLNEFELVNKMKIKKVFCRASIIQTPSFFLQSYFQKKGYKVHYLPNSISLEKFPYSNKQRKAFSLLWVRAFTPIYNPDVPVRVLHQLLKIYPNASLTLIGPDKGCQFEVKALAEELDVSQHVEFVGIVKNDELYRYYQSHSLYLNTTSYESFGVAVLEAASCGIPIVSNTVGEIPYLWENEKDILLVKGNNLNEYINHIINIFENDSLSNELSINARNKAEKFDWEMVKNNWLDLLN
ncbi:MAG: glycosyltransferase family 4 protein [Chitinophagaceae bacterium]|jgi:glycosyltransferase involved in cell wall biosynthesis|nr:glycosyltransferase family 4 protein [Chitinophagaceae bacterium]